MRQIEIDGIVDSLKNHCKRINISRQGVYDRMKRNKCDVIEALSMGAGGSVGRKEKRVKCNGVVDTVTSHCESVGISYSAVWYRVRAWGCSIEEALNIPLQNRGRKPLLYEYKGKVDTLRNHCKGEDFTTSHLYYKLKGIK